MPINNTSTYIFVFALVFLLIEHETLAFFLVSVFPKYPRKVSACLFLNYAIVVCPIEMSAHTLSALLDVFPRLLSILPEAIGWFIENVGWLISFPSVFQKRISQQSNVGRNSQNNLCGNGIKKTNQWTGRDQVI